MRIFQVNAITSIWYHNYLNSNELLDKAVLGMAIENWYGRVNKIGRIFLPM